MDNKCNAHVTFFSKLWDNSYIHNVKYCWYRNHTTDDNLVYYQVGQLCTTHHETQQYKEGTLAHVPGNVTVHSSPPIPRLNSTKKVN